MYFVLQTGEEFDHVAVTLLGYLVSCGSEE
jgi:hypothetical protein